MSVFNIYFGDSFPSTILLRVIPEVKLFHTTMIFLLMVE